MPVSWMFKDHSRVSFGDKGGASRNVVGGILRLCFVLLHQSMLSESVLKTYFEHLLTETSEEFETLLRLEIVSSRQSPHKTAAD